MPPADEDPDNFRIPTVTLDAKVLCANGDRIAGRLYLAAGTTHHPGPMLPEERLNDVSRFFPFLPEGAEAPVILNKREVAVVTVPAVAEAVDEFDVRPPRQLRRIELECVGTKLDGFLVIEMPVAQSRVLDHLNRDEHFVTLEKDGEHHIVNKSWITRVVEREAG